MKERKARFEDALHATRAASEEGVLPGGGVALIRAGKVLENVSLTSEDERIGVEVVRRALAAPARMIGENAGVEGTVLVRNVARGEGAYGFNAETGEYGDLIKAGVIDPLKVTRNALQNAASASATLLTTTCAIAEKKEKAKKGGPGGGMPGGMGGGMGGMPGMGGMGGMGMDDMGDMGGMGGMGGMDDMDF
jgi:chaperonin GroEL